MNLVERFRAHLVERELIRPGQHVVVAVSGGVDSVVLLHLLLTLRDEMHLVCTVAHLNHGLRGAEADQDQRSVEALARELNVPCVSGKRDVRRFSQDQHLSIEAAARVVRYDFLFRVKEQVGADCVATGHNADDQVETVVDHFLRGSGLLGLAGMTERRGDLVRPLLWAHRKDIEGYAAEHGIIPRSDRTNFDVAYRRNRIRLELIPYLRRYFNPNISEAMLRIAQIASEAEKFVEAEARARVREVSLERSNEKIVLDIGQLTKYIKLIRKYVIILAFEELGGRRWALGFDTLARVLFLTEHAHSGATVELGSGFRATRSRETLALHRLREVRFQRQIPPGDDVLVPELGLVFGSQFVGRKVFEAEVGVNPCVEFIDYGKARGTLSLRNARRGDRFHPLGSPGMKKLSDFFIDEHVPVYQRWRTPVLEDGTNIVWVCGLRLDDRYKVDSRTKEILKVEMGEAVGGEE